MPGDELDDLVAAFRALEAIHASMRSFLVLVCYAYVRFYRTNQSRRCLNTRTRRYNLTHRVTRQLDHIRYLTTTNDVTCINHIRMSRDTFSRLCYLLEHLGGLQPTFHLPITEQVCIFLTILSHHKKNRVVKDDFTRSGYTISKHFNSVLISLLQLHNILLVHPSPVDVGERVDRWKYFVGCLGVLDDTYIPVKVSLRDKARYRNRKGNVSVNVLAVCDRNMNYVYVLSGWEGSAADGRVLRDAITRPNGLKVPSGNFYLCDEGYTNGQGFLAPYRGVRYHLQEWNNVSHPPQTPQEFFNLMHARARNVIERSFGILKARWGILRSHLYYPIKTQNYIILACCLLHNFIRTNANEDPLESDVPDISLEGHDPPQNEPSYIDQVESTQEWSTWRDNIAMQMWSDRNSTA